jgi:DNA replication protein DnaC
MEADLLLREYCKKLRLPTVAANTHRFAQDAAHNNLPYERFLLTLLECEVRQRALNQERRHIQAAHFPVLYTLDTFNFDAIPQLNKLRILELAQGEWIKRHENVILVGDVGTGKTHIGTALAVAACHQGRRVRFFTAAGLVNTLIEAQDEHRLNKLLASLLRMDLIMLDELGFPWAWPQDRLPFNARGSQLLFQFCSERYLRGSLLITTNLTFDRWGELLGDPLLGGALVDRLTHHCHLIEFRGSSYRFRQSLTRQSATQPMSAQFPRQIAQDDTEATA